MIFFDYKGLKKSANSDPKKMLWLLSDLVNRKSLMDAKLLKNISGSSFLIRPMPLIRDNITDIYYKIQYLELASMRDYTSYKLYNFSGLDTSLWPELEATAYSIKHNPLLTLEKQIINFKHETGL